jgi:hypothetical protein
VNSPPPKPEVILTNFFAEPTVLLVPITSRVVAIPTDIFIYHQLDSPGTYTLSNTKCLPHAYNNLSFPEQYETGTLSP